MLPASQNPASFGAHWDGTAGLQLVCRRLGRLQRCISAFLPEMKEVPPLNNCFLPISSQSHAAPAAPLSDGD